MNIAIFLDEVLPKSERALVIVPKSQQEARPPRPRRGNSDRLAQEIEVAIVSLHGELFHGNLVHRIRRRISPPIHARSFI